ncbi:MAG TPA: hypothetical protein VKN35_10925 [Xanthomonadales bacterium]|nr:hypothetical protein [Xanthomonadales bacterium]
MGRTRQPQDAQKHDRERDQELDGDLQRIRAAFQNLQHDDPPELLDQAIINLARRELEGQQKQRKRRMQWIGALSSMALLLITLNLVVDHQGASPRPPESGSKFRKEQDGAGADAIFESRRESSALAPAQDEPAVPVQRSMEMTQSATLSDAAEEQGELEFKSELSAWIERIRKLREEGQTDQAQAELQSFRQAYPEYPVPEDLK